MVAMREIAQRLRIGRGKWEENQRKENGRTFGLWKIACSFSRFYNERKRKCTLKVLAQKKTEVKMRDEKSVRPVKG